LQATLGLHVTPAAAQDALSHSVQNNMVQFIGVFCNVDHWRPPRLPLHA